MYCITNVGAVSGSEAFLIVTEIKTALIDSGFAFCADQMIENIKKILGDRPLDYVLLTHSHYDHASGSVYCREVWPNVQIIAGSYTNKIFAKPTAIKVIKEMNQNAAKQFGVVSYSDRLDKLSVDIAVKDGDIVDLGSLKLRVIEASGHTKCSIAFYDEKEKLLISCETMGGVYVDDDTVLPCYLVGYQMSMDFISRVKALGIDKILVPHIGFLAGDNCKKYIESARYWNEELKNRTVKGHIEGKTNEELVEEYKARFYSDMVKIYQPEKAFDLNASYTIPMLIRECVGEGE